MSLARSGLSSARSGLQTDSAEPTQTRSSFASLFATLPSAQFLVVEDRPDLGESFAPHVEYECIVEGHKYCGARLRYGQTGNWSRKQAEQAIGTYFVGTFAPVSFNPRNPADAVLVCGTSWGNLAIVLSGLAFLMISSKEGRQTAELQ
jgi:hypothetical protein